MVRALGYHNILIMTDQRCSNFTAIHWMNGYPSICIPIEFKRSLHHPHFNCVVNWYRPRRTKNVRNPYADSVAVYLPLKCSQHVIGKFAPGQIDLGLGCNVAILRMVTKGACSSFCWQRRHLSRAISGQCMSRSYMTATPSADMSMMLWSQIRLSKCTGRSRAFLSAYDACKMLSVARCGLKPC